ncbi:hypothetical protein [Paenibacillus sp. 22594]|uniref:hypothetical protein n=1 Tax=Paenibacillus sp. 22594 TaxID=3453947 RepID=UPI003F839378
MKLTINMLRNVCVMFLTLRDQAEAEGLTQAAANADKAYRNYQELLYQANGKRPSGVGAGQPSVTFKFTIKSRLPLLGVEGNDQTSDICQADRITAEDPRVIPLPSGVSLHTPKTINGYQL